MTNYEARFGGIGRLFSTAGADRLRRAHVCIIGIGGVGSWAVEALARTGVGSLTLVDLDDVCISNVNRQLHALTGEFGKPKVEVMAARVKLINPDCAMRAEQMLFTSGTAGKILAPKFACVLDAIDDRPTKALLIARCRERGIPIITTGGAGGRRDPTAVRTNDLARATHCGLLANVRQLLRAEYGFPRDPRQNFGVPCVYSRGASFSGERRVRLRGARTRFSAATGLPQRLRHGDVCDGGVWFRGSGGSGADDRGGRSHEGTRMNAQPTL